MKAHLHAVWILVGTSLLMGNALSRPVDLSAPTGGIGSAGLYGDLQLWREVDGVGLQLGQGSYLPFRYRFSSNDNAGGILGPGFYCPMFEAKNVLLREQMMRAFLPCGKGLYLRRDTADLTKFQTLDGEWTGLLNNNGDDFTLWREDGWKLLYHKGHLTSLVTDDNHTFTWNYENGMPSGVSKDGQTIITIEPNVAGQVAAFIFDGKRYEVGYAERPMTQVLMGQTAIKELAQTLSTFKYPDGTMDTFKFVLTPDRIPTLTFTDKNKQQILYSWDAATNHLATEKGPQGDWTYNVGSVTQDYGVPTITRSNSAGKTESMAIDTKIGTYTKQLADGTTTVTHIFETPGPLYNQVKKIEKIANGQTTTVFQASYDEAGNLIRNIDEKGYITSFTYDEKGALTSQIRSLPKDPLLLSKIIEKEHQLTDIVSKSLTSDGRQDALRTLAQFYLFDKLDPSKAVSVIMQLDHKHAFGVKLQAIDFDESLNSSQKIAQYQTLLAEYPEQKTRIDFLIGATQKIGRE